MWRACRAAISTVLRGGGLGSRAMVKVLLRRLGTGVLCPSFLVILARVEFEIFNDCCGRRACSMSFSARRKRSGLVLRFDELGSLR